MQFWLLILLFLPLICGLLLFFRISRQKQTGYLVLTFSTTTFLLLLAGIYWFGFASSGDIILYRWFNMGELAIDFSFIFDQLTWTMLIFIGFISLLVQIFALEYMKSVTDNIQAYRRFFRNINFFVFIMFLLVSVNDLIILFICWELISIISFLLIGFNYFDNSANRSSILAFVVGRIGDLLMLIGICLLVIATGETKIELITQALAENSQLNTGGISILLISMSLITGGLISKSAQLPLYFWLPNAMVAPLPVSALIHSATMVSAGIFLILRLMPLYIEVTLLLDWLIVLGAVTSLITAINAISSKNIKELLAYSTISHLGLILVILIMGASSNPIEELISHGLYKVLLFLVLGVFLLDKVETNTDFLNRKNKIIKLTKWMLIIGIYSMLPLPFSLANSSIVDLSNNLLANHNGFNTLIFIFINLSILFSAIYGVKIIFLLNHHLPDQIIKKLPQLFVNYQTLLPILFLAIVSVIFGIEKSSGNIQTEIYLGLSSQPFWMVIIGFTIGWLFFYQYPNILPKLVEHPIFYPIYRVFEQNFYIVQFIVLINKKSNRLSLRLHETVEPIIFPKTICWLVSNWINLAQKLVKIEKAGLVQLVINLVVSVLLFVVVFISIS